MNPAPLTYQLKSAPASALGARQRAVIFYQAQHAAVQARPGLNTHAFTTKVLGRFQSFKTLPETEFWKLVNAFKEIAAKGPCDCKAAPSGADAQQASAELLNARSTTGPGAHATATVDAPPAVPLVCPAPALPTLPAPAQRATLTPGNVDAEKTYTAAQIATALDTWPRAVRRRLANTPSQTTIVAGQPTAAWPLAALPAEWQAHLADLRERGGWRSVHHLLTQPSQGWEPPLPLRDCAPAAVEKAIQLRTALAGALARRNDLPGPELAALGLADYQRTFGHGITARHWWNLLHRTLERAGTDENFQRLELYLDERPPRKVEAQPVREPQAEAERLHRLRVAASRCVNPTALTDAEQRTLWEAACATLAAELELGEPPHRARRVVLDFLWRHTPGLAATEAALRVAFVRKFARWRAGGFEAVALADKRSEANRARALPVSQEDLDTLIGHTVFICDGRVSQGVRECLQQRLVSEALLGRILHNPASKSYVPTWLRDRVKHEVAMLRDVHHGPTKTRDNGAYLDRCWDSVAALDWWNADDLTAPLYYWVRAADAKSGFALMRGQFLLMIDTRSTAILGYALMPERNYNARTIRTLITRTADNYGLPRQGFYFERGIWKDAKILTGDKGETNVEWAQAEQGLKEFGLRFIHAIRARSKPVERVLGALQSYMEGEPGYCGRDERHDGFESFARLKREIESGKVSPEGRLFSMEQWDARLGELCARYNAEPQQGKHTGGLSPEAALEKHQRAGDPTVRFDARCRYLLAHHKRPVRVTANGITLRFGKQAFNYRNARTGALRGQTVLAFFNPDAPELLTVTDMDRGNAFCVERSQSVPALDAPEELLAQELGRIEEHMGYATTRYRILKPKFTLPFRANVVSPAVQEIGAAITAARQQMTDESATRTKARKVAASVGMRPENLRRPDQIEAAEELSRLLNEVETPETNA